ncbi:transcriptional coactivator p15/PC4 family protein [Paraburkholderia sp.]|uniref:transcriptional coactivator p15/PC4 family protein n=1 Tax=Paraburkholderia sp. TaxID=1926495 RepID=UPI003C7A3197
MADKSHSTSQSGGANAAATRFLDLPKSAGERLRVELREYRGRLFVDVRNWFLSPDKEWQASSKGVTLRPEQIPEVVRALVLAGGAIDPHGGR